MCKEDVKIGRQRTAVASAGGQVDSGDPVRLLGSNPNRGAALVGLTIGDAAGFTVGVLIRCYSATGPVIAALNQAHPQALLRVEDFGDAVTSELWATTTGADTYRVVATSLEWNLDLRDL